MKFSNFVSTLAVVCLTFNADALKVQNDEEDAKAKHDFDRYTTPESIKNWLEILEDGPAACEYGILKLIKPEYQKYKELMEYIYPERKETRSHKYDDKI